MHIPLLSHYFILYSILYRITLFPLFRRTDFSIDVHEATNDNSQAHICSTLPQTFIHRKTLHRKLLSNIICELFSARCWDMLQSSTHFGHCRELYTSNMTAMFSYTQQCSAICTYMVILYCIQHEINISMCENANVTFVLDKIRIKMTM